jgi:hypothetical protein
MLNQEVARRVFCAARRMDEKVETIELNRHCPSALGVADDRTFESGRPQPWTK